MITTNILLFAFLNQNFFLTLTPFKDVFFCNPQFQQKINGRKFDVIQAS